MSIKRKKERNFDLFAISKMQHLTSMSFNNFFFFSNYFVHVRLHYDEL